MSTLYREVNSCRFCHSTRLESALDLGQPCISDFIQPDGAEDRAPLELMLCYDCGLVQLHHTVNRDRLYKSYYYQSGTNESMVLALKDIVDDSYPRVDLEIYDQVLDIGCNDGTLLAQYGYKHFDGLVPDGDKRRVPLIRIGFEPCASMAEKARSKEGVYLVVNSFFPPGPALHYVMPVRPKVITSIAMLYDIDDMDSFVATVKEWLHDDGIWIVQLQGLGDMLYRGSFDNICHEHLLYISPSPFAKLLNRHGLEIEEISYNDTNGSSTRYIIRHSGKCRSSQYIPSIDANDLRSELARFADAISLLKTQTLRTLQSIKQKGKLVLGVAASTKANTYLQHFGIDPELLPTIGERNPDKHGLVTVGSHIPIISEKEMLDKRPNYLLALAWHFIKSFRSRYPHFESTSGRWIVGLPELKVLEPEKINAHRIYKLKKPEVPECLYTTDRL